MHQCRFANAHPVQIAGFRRNANLLSQNILISSKAERNSLNKMGIDFPLLVQGTLTQRHCYVMSSYSERPPRFFFFYFILGLDLYCCSLDLKGEKSYFSYLQSIFWFRKHFLNHAMSRAFVHELKYLTAYHHEWVVPVLTWNKNNLHLSQSRRTTHTKPQEFHSMTKLESKFILALRIRKLCSNKWISHT